MRVDINLLTSRCYNRLSWCQKGLIFLNMHPPFYGFVIARYAHVLKELPVKARTSLLKDCHPLLGSVTQAFWRMACSLPVHLQRLLLEELFHKGSYQQVTKNFLHLLCHYKRLACLPHILSFTKDLIQKETHQEVYLACPTRLTTAQTAVLEKKLSNLFSKKASVHQVEDANLFYGSVMIWDTFLLDMSLAHIFSQLKKGVTDDTSIA